MTDSDLTAFQASQLQFLRQQVDKFQEEKWRRDARSSATQDLDSARQELSDFVRNYTQDCGKG
jgi:hypothetical protein